ncbi:MAG: aspartate aminotransferase family protein [Verrucomicrobia bacterium]|jgi:acetylornithine/N-succinyldiaminopimelate aminotransferase|nr:aspartate aminotransferase family protein [Verrucomicrobiota bacterium]MDA0905430.1 aspartate aminotransferase family protein [Verrucomicrobiota bacterium]MDA1078006.1 aspartate aminotransferase family protein [Verrucomicrobiota bacterium]
MDFIRKHQTFLIGNYAPPAIEIVRGKGSHLWDSQGKKYLDFTSGIAVTNLGHSHPEWIKQVQHQVELLAHCSNLYSIPEQVRLAERLARKIGPGKVLFCNSGAEANEALIKLSRLHGEQGEGKRTKILVARNGFHGRTLGALSATESSKYRKGFEPLLPGFVFCKLNELSDFENAIDDETVAILVESIQGEGGLHVSSDSFLQGIEKLCQKNNLLFLMDEVQAGIARTGEFLGYQKSGVQPDAIAMAKGLGGGFPIGAIWVKDSSSSLFTPGSHGTTFGGSPLACSAAHAVLDVIEKEDLIAQAKVLGDYLLQGIQKLAENFPKKILEIRGRGLMLGVQLADEPGELVSILRDNGLLAVGAAGQTLRLLPPLTITQDEIDQGLKILRQSLSAFEPKKIVP